MIGEHTENLEKSYKEQTSFARCNRFSLVAVMLFLSVNSFLTDDGVRSFCGHCRSRSDSTERAV